MEECNIFNDRYSELFGVDAPELTQDFSSHWEILTRNADVPLSRWLPCIGETGDLFKYDSLEAM
jgi:hypothetical protein